MCEGVCVRVCAVMVIIHTGASKRHVWLCHRIEVNNSGTYTQASHDRHMTVT